MWDLNPRGFFKPADLKLSEHFISVQDDIMLGRPAKPGDFFTSEGKPYSWRKQPTWSDGITGAHHRVSNHTTTRRLYSGSIPAGVVDLQCLWSVAPCI